MNANTFRSFLCFFFLFTVMVIEVNGQRGYKSISTAASFLLVGPDARTTAVGEAATGLLGDANSAFANGAKLSFAGEGGVSLSYTPWMREISNELQMSYLSAYKQLGNRSTLGFSFRYLDLGNVNFRDDQGMLLAQQQLNELALDATFSKKLGENLAMALTGRYIRSSLGSGAFNGADMSAANALAADVGIYSENVNGSSRWAWGVSLSNIGTKVTYDKNSGNQSFLPMNIRAGLGYTLMSSGPHKLTLLFDATKLLVPSPPKYVQDDGGISSGQILKGKDPGRSVASALFTSFYDAPGGFKEEMAEISIAGGLEFDFKEQIFFRTGYFYENPEKGNRQYLSAGLGLKLRPLQFDVAYMAPMNRTFAFRNGLKLTLSYQITR